MRAVRCHAWGPCDALVVEELPALRPQAGEVLIEVDAASVNFTDLLFIEGKYQTKPALPFTPGSEVAGTVGALGQGVTNVRVGTRVAAFVDLGGFAEQAVCPAEKLIPIPPDVDAEVAAVFTMAYSTAYHAVVERGRLQAGETLLVLGAAGGVGLAAVEIGKAVGARVIATASSDAKLAVCKAHGADALIDYAKQDLRAAIKQATGGKGPDMIFDPVGGDCTEPALRSLARRGRYLVIGFASGQIPKIALNLPLLKEASVIGVYWGEFAGPELQPNMAAMARLLGWLCEGKLKPLISARYPLSQVPKALAALASRSATGKIVVVPSLPH
ncbi:MAG: Phthiocerol/phenolphthiocerol synthesis polyketide synthase type I PpsC [Burkholderiaceae bacterium]|nr:Phthiocerol/phenolphthiocerol synthesis polyketide synthase type I PpsC [Burkholderiaceae bacterium]